MTRIYQEKEGMRLLGKGDRTIYISYDIDGYKEIIAWMEDALKLKKEPPPVYKIPFEGMDRERAAVRMKQAKIFYIVMICLPLPLWLAALYFNDTRYVTETQPWLFYGLCSLNLLQLFAIWYFDGVSMLDSPQLGIVILSACAYFLINACIAMFGSLQGLHIKSSWGLWGYTLLLEIFLFLCYLLVSYQVNIPYQQKFAFFIFYGLCFLWGGYYMIYYTNNALDKSSPVSYTGIIVDKHIELGKGSLKKYYIKVKWKEKSVEEFWILNAQYDKMPVSYKIEVRERPGLLNIPWMEFFDPATGKKL
ncbi:hypothetical protein [Chitinophaga sp. Cy-1792]|uniref:hypothetical protein n=1 Tax=Chitinophaga sp. Cy-1792 TaxID=2608339 RepID=UPI001423F28A|nr:hypothetical protein [Chitinophaga sp. Cy-1792]NIG53893.1 hypothetical protein [Chitinophaga sp. Cy-1792]